MPTTPVPAVEGWFTTDEEPHLLGHPLHHLRHGVLPEGDRVLPQPGVPGPRVRRGRAVPHRHGLELHRRPVPAAAALHPAGRASTSRSPSPRSSWPTEQLVILGQVAKGYGVDDLAVGATVELVVEPLYELDGVAAPDLPLEAGGRR